MFKRYALATTILFGLAGIATAGYWGGMEAYEKSEYKTAIQEFTDAAKQGDAESEYMLGKIYEQGQGTAQDYAAAHKWYNLAAAQGHEEARKARDALASRMSSAQIAAAQEAAAAFDVSAARDDGGARADDDMRVGTASTYSIANIQASLNRLGYDAGPVDGLLGGKTRSAIRDFQRDKGYSISGEPSRVLFDRLQGAVADAKQADETDRIAQMSRNELISELQTRLKTAGYEIDAVDGELGPKTEAAIEDYQSAHQLPVTGRPTPALLAYVRNSDSLGRERQQPQTEDEYADLTRRQLVRRVQEELNQQGYDAGSVDGLMGSNTRSAIRDFQRDAGLSVDGRADDALLARLETNGQTAESRTAESDLVRDIERELRNRNYQVGRIDGRLDDDTRAAIRTYQRDEGLKITGEPSEALRMTLMAAAGGNAPINAEKAARGLMDELTEKMLKDNDPVSN